MTPMIQSINIACFEFTPVCRNETRSNCYDEIKVRMFEGQKGTDYQADLHAVTEQYIQIRSFFGPL